MIEFLVIFLHPECPGYLLPCITTSVCAFGRHLHYFHPVETVLAHGGGQQCSGQDSTLLNYLKEPMVVPTILASSAILHPGVRYLSLLFLDNDKQITLKDSGNIPILILEYWIQYQIDLNHMPPRNKEKRTKTIKLYEKSENSESVNKQELIKETLEKMDYEDSVAEHDAVLLTAQTGRHKKKKVLNYTRIPYKLSVETQSKIEAVDPSLHSTIIFSKIIQKQFEINSQFVSEESKFKEYLNSFKETLLKRVEGYHLERRKAIKAQELNDEEQQEKEVQDRISDVGISIGKVYNRSRLHYRNRRAKNRLSLQRGEELDTSITTQGRIRERLMDMIKMMAQEVHWNEISGYIQNLEQQLTIDHMEKMWKRKKQIEDLKEYFQGTLRSAYKLNEKINLAFQKINLLSEYNSNQDSFKSTLFDPHCIWTKEKIFASTN